MEINHNPVLFKTTAFNSDDLSFINYGFMIENGKSELHYVYEYSRKSYKSKTWTEKTLYNRSTMHRVPDDLCIPEGIIADSVIFMQAMIIAGILANKEM